MPLFKRKSPSNPTSSRYLARSDEQLVRPAFTPPDLVQQQQQQQQHHHHHHHLHFHRHHPNSSRSNLDDFTDRTGYRADGQTAASPTPNSATRASPTLQQHSSQPEPTQSSLHRSQSQRQPHLQQPQPLPPPRNPQRQSNPPPQQDRPTVSLVSPEDPQPRRSRRGLFVRPSSGLLERRVSVKGKAISHPTSQPNSPQRPHVLSGAPEEDTYNQQYYSENQSPITAPHTPHAFEPRSTSLAYHQQHQHQQHPHPQPQPQPQPQQQQQQQQPQQLPQQLQLPQPQQPPAQQHQPPTSRPSPLESTDPDAGSLDQHSSRPSPTDTVPDSPRYSSDQQGHNRGPSQSRIQQDLVFHSRPPSRQTYEPLSPVRSHTHPDAMQQASSQAPPGPPTINDRPPGDSRRGSTTAPQAMPETTRGGTPTGNRTREEDIDVRALLQKHEELQSKYSKVKRYYFDKEAQVQHLQNTVAHQRMAVSRTVLDDNEYANRFQRLDGAIKDLSFSVRKDWRGIPPWLHGLVSDDATMVGMKEMTSVGRAVVSRWLVEEVFQRHFHPGLDPALSVQLKSIEMNLRRQQTRPSTEEDRDNALVRLSNWRRTTFDGLGDTLSTPEAQEHRAELIEHLTAELASFLSSQLHDHALPGLEAGVRMIIENSINIAEKIPLEARDVCVEYFPPNVPFLEGYMKVEGQLPPLAQHPPPPSDQEPDDPPAAESDSSPASNSTGTGDVGSPPQNKPPKKSMFGALIGRRPGGPEGARPGPGPSPGPAAAGPQPDEKAIQVDERDSQPRIRFASFMTVEVRGKGPAMVLIKAPVWLIECELKGPRE
ncbi:hypothetical protein N7462_008116 [Penicillium macrosclerotiorum]|uniref:uncharacterized protein n=1 Tax=Penicillium macrosclerotiorum TaxID=303699 RepID=UPI002547CE01|nr:uncharacterized protein N7462_008116 [Penicillium macrosclerotiorum]KAJ5679872.1 hypothetical protein N7462_008116 [Penicillium macrosclerotiorum]